MLYIRTRVGMRSDAPRPSRTRWIALLLALLLAACDIVAFPAPPDDAAADEPAPSAAPSPTPAPIALPAPELLARAQRHRALGEYDTMAEDLRALLDAHPNAAEARPAQFYLAESYALRGRWTSAVEALRDFVGREPRDELRVRGLFLLARGYEEAGNWADAVATYDSYRA